MIALLRADWVRFRRRRDLWVILVGVCLIGGITFLANCQSDAQNPPPFDPSAFEREIVDSGMLEGIPDADKDALRAQLLSDMEASALQELADHQARKEIALQRYAFPQSILTIVGSGILPILALILIATILVGDEFRYGTIRTSLLAASNRRRFLTARLISLFAMAALLFVALLTLGAILALGLAVTGAEMRSSAAIDPLSTLGLIGAHLLTTMVLVAFATALTVILRSGALTLLLVILALLLELFVGSLPVFAQGQPLAAVPQFFLSSGIRALQADLGLATGGLVFADAQTPPVMIELGLPMLVAIVLAWGLVFLVIADRRIRTMDIVE